VFARLKRLFGSLWSTRRRALLSAAVLLGLAAGIAFGGRALWLEHHFRAAVEAQERRDFGAALDHLAPYLAAYPDSGRAQFLAARAARRAGRLDEAETHLDACRRLNYPGEELDLERALLLVARRRPVNEDYLRRRATRDDADAPLVLEVLTDEYLRNYRLLDALWALNQFLERKPSDVPALLGRAFVWEKINSFGDAETDYRRALDLDPGNSAGRRRFADLLLTRRGSPDEAAAEYENLLRRDPDDAASRLGLARCRRQSARLDESRELLQALLGRTPPYPGALTEMGRVAADEGQTADAIDWLNKATADAPWDRQAYAALANCLREAGRDQEERDCRRSLDRLDADLKRIDELTRAALAHPYDPSLRYEIGVLCLRNGEEAEGVRWLEMVLERDPEHREAHRALAEHFEARGQAEFAARHRRVAPRQ
jgi:predicted Zn-dependent protease